MVTISQEVNVVSGEKGPKRKRPLAFDPSEVITIVHTTPCERSACRFIRMFSGHGRRMSSGLLVALLCVVLHPLAAHADNSYLDADPQPKSQVSLEPSRVTVAFHDSVPRSGATIVVRDSSGKDVSNGAFQVEANNIYVNLAYPFPKGTYTVYYRVSDQDGTPFGGQYQFSYGPGSFAADSTKTWRGPSSIPKVVALPSDTGNGAGLPTDSPTPSESTPTVDPSAEPSASGESDTDGDSADTTATTSEKLLWTGGAVAALLLTAGAIVVARKRRA